MYFKQAFKGENDWWRYIVVTVLVFLGYNIGGIPIVLARLKSQEQHSELGNVDLSTFMENFDSYGINANLGLSLMLLFFVAAITVFYFVFGPFHRREFKTLSTSATRIRYSRVFFAFCTWLSLALIVEAVGYFLNPGQYTWNFNSATFIPLILICIFVLPLQTSFEELFFRGYLMQGIGTARWRNVIVVFFSFLLTFGLASLTSDWRANIINTQANETYGSIMSTISNLVILLLFLGLCKVGVDYVRNNELHSFGIRNYKLIPLLVTSILFGLVHGTNPEVQSFGTGIMMTYYISAGLMLGIMTIMDDGLELALGTHAATNFTAAVFVGYEGSVIKTDSLFVAQDLNPYFMTVSFYIVGAVFLFILKRKYKWTTFNKLLEPISKPDEDKQLDKHLSKHLVNN